MARHSSIVLFYLLCKFNYFCLTIKVLESTVELGEVKVSGAKIIEPSHPVDTEDLTICMRFNLKTLSGPNNRVHPISVMNDPSEQSLKINSVMRIMFWLKITKLSSFLIFGSNEKIKGSYKATILLSKDEHGIKEMFAANRWMHLCIGYRKRDGMLTVIRNGEVVSGNVPDPDLTKVVFWRDLLSYVQIGRCGVWRDQGACSSPKGEYTDYNMWDRYLSVEDMKDWTTCKDNSKGNILNWDEATFSLENMIEKDVALEEVCKPVRPGHTIFPSLQTLQQLRSFCLKFQGIVSVVKSKELNEQMAAESWVHQDDCFTPSVGMTFWNGWHDTNSEGTFTDINDNSTLTNDMYQNWQLSEPNGENMENCVATYSEEKFWNDLTCGAKLCGFCQLDIAPVFTLRGLCDETHFDTKYSWTRNFENSHYILRGYSNSLIKHNGNNEWMLSIYNNNVTYAIINYPEYPIGKLAWTVHNDLCNENLTVEIVLNLNACNESEFNCDNGQCIPMENRCDSRIHCNDKSDEVDCVVYEKDHSYIKTMPPQAAIESSITTVELELDVLAVLELNEVDSILAMQMELHLTWSDNRLSMTNLADEATLNYLPLEARQGIWLPEVIFYNTEIKTETVNDEKAFAYVIKEGRYKRREVEFLQNSYLYKGEENPITLSRVYSDKFICDYDMTVYPFDKQECFAVFVMKGKFDKFVKLLAKNASYHGPKDLPQYFVIETEASEIIVPPSTKAIQVRISFGRRVLSTVLSSYLPTFLICILTFCTSHFKGFYFEAIVTVNLTSMLALTTLFVSIFDSLPNTSYIKMIDIWLIFCLTIPFLEVILQTYQEYLRVDEKAQQDLIIMINHHGQKNLVKPTSKDNSDESTGNGDRAFYERNEASKKENGKRYKILTKLITFGVPAYFFSFTLIYFIVGFAIMD